MHSTRDPFKQTQQRSNQIKDQLPENLIQFNDQITSTFQHNKVKGMILYANHKTRFNQLTRGKMSKKSM